MRGAPDWIAEVLSPSTAGYDRAVKVDKLSVSFEPGLGDAVRFEGVGGQAMAREGLASLFPIEELSIMGLAAVVKQLPKILTLIRMTSTAVTESSPDVLVIIDSPDFTHRVAKRVRARDPSIPIVDYVSPSVWAWRPGRARAMRSYIDHILALLPFEPAVHERLGERKESFIKGRDGSFSAHGVAHEHHDKINDLVVSHTSASKLHSLLNSFLQATVAQHMSQNRHFS